MRRMFGAACLGLGLAAAVPDPAWATFGGPTDDTALSLKELMPRAHGGTANTSVSLSQQTLETLGSNSAGEKPLTDATAALRQQITAQLSGSAPVDEAQLQALARQIFALRKQCDAFDIEREVALRATLTPQQLAAVAQRRQELAALSEQKHAVAPMERAVAASRTL